MSAFELTRTFSRDYGFYALSANAGVAATSIVVDQVPGILRGNAGQFVIIDVGTTEAELREITTVSGNTLSFTRALTYAHASGDPVYLVGLAAQGDLIPWSWWGGLSFQNTDAAATINVTAFNRLMGPSGEIYNVGRFGISIDGTYYVNDQLKPERSTAMVGHSPITTAIIARSGFPFTAAGDVAIIHPYRDGSPVLFEQAGPSGRWIFRNFSVNGNNLTDSNGIISSPQQPDSTENLRIQNCLGDYGLGLMDVQYHDMRNVQLHGCGLSLYMWNCNFVRTYNLNMTSPVGLTGIKLYGGSSNSFFGALVENANTDGKIFEVVGGASKLGFYDIYTSGFVPTGTGTFFHFDSADNPSGKCTYILSNVFCEQPSATVKMVDDIQRSISFDSVQADRALIFGYAQNNMYYFVLGGTTIVRQSGPIEFGPWSTGPTVRSGSGTPEGSIPAPVGSLYMRTDGGAATSLYVKESGTGNTGWVGK